MILKAERIAALLRDEKKSRDPLIIRPTPNVKDLRSSGSASVDLRLGRWLATFRGNRMPLLKILDDPANGERHRHLVARMRAALDTDPQVDQPRTLAAVHAVARLSEDSSERRNEAGIIKSHFVPFGKTFVLHPRSFILATTLEWLRLTTGLAGYVIGKSSWGRRGLIIATAAGVHPGFTGCLTLEVTNVGEVPIELRPGIPICQLFLHEVRKTSRRVDQTQYIGRRKPWLGRIEMDEIAQKLAGTNQRKDTSTPG